jgi:hypothetical protein
MRVVPTPRRHNRFGEERLSIDAYATPTGKPESIRIFSAERTRFAFRHPEAGELKHMPLRVTARIEVH